MAKICHELVELIEKSCNVVIVVGQMTVTKACKMQNSVYVYDEMGKKKKKKNLHSPYINWFNAFAIELNVSF